LKLLPNRKPSLKAGEIEAIIAANKIDRTKFPVVIVGIRGHILDMGKAGQNDRGLFDDAGFVHSPTAFVAVNFNTDPSTYRKGRGRGSEKGMAVLDTGLWMYRVGPHRGKSPALRQAAPVTVTRDGDPPYKDSGDFAINHHWGRSSSTSSAGCQTVPTEQWPSYINTIVSELKRYGQKVVPYILVEEDKRLRGILKA
jgi:lysozyme